MWERNGGLGLASLAAPCALLQESIRMETVKIILNPSFERGRGKRVSGETRAAFERAGVPYDLVETTAAGEATSLARAARLDGYAIVAAAGGRIRIPEETP